MVYFPRTFIAEYRVARTLPLLSSAGWWVNRWPFLGLLETAVKLCAFLAAAYVPLDASSAPPATVLERAPFYAQTFLFFGGTVILSLAIFERVLLYRELISLAFVLPNIWAHFTVLAAMYRGRAAVSVFHFRVFLALMLAGDVVKLVFFAVHDFSMLNIARYIIYLLVFCFTVLYTLILLLDFGYMHPFATECVQICITLLPFLKAKTA